MIQQSSSFALIPLWLIISREDALHQLVRLLILAVGNGRRRNDWGSSQTMFTSWQRCLALCVCSSKHFHLAHFWSSCLIFLWRQKSFKPNSILGQHIYWRLALQYLRGDQHCSLIYESMPPTNGIGQGARATLAMLLPAHTMGFGYQEENTWYPPPPDLCTAAALDWRGLFWEFVWIIELNSIFKKGDPHPCEGETCVPVLLLAGKM